MNSFLQGAPLAGTMLCIFTITAVLELTKRQRQRKKENLLSLLSSIADKNSLNISKNDIFGDHILAYDEDRQAVFFFYPQQNDILIFNISDITDCSIQKSVAGSVINQIDLCLKSQVNGPTYMLPLYSRFQDSGRRGRAMARRAEKWKTLIESAIIEKKLSALRDQK